MRLAILKSWCLKMAALEREAGDPEISAGVMAMDPTKYPIKNQILRRALAKQNECPECGDELDTGWECTECGFDARPLALEAARREGEEI